MQQPDTDYQTWKPSEALVPVSQDGPRTVLDPTAGGNPYWTSLQPSDASQKRLLRHCLGTADESPHDWFGRPFATEHVFVHQVELADPESSEVLMLTRLVLVGPDGRTLSTCSSGAIRSLRAIIATEGPPPWRPPLKIVFHPVKTRRGFTTYNLDLDDSKPEPTTKTKRS